MDFNVIDIIIFVALLLGTCVGYSSGVIKKAASSIGIFVIIVIGLIIKNPIANLLYTYFPFFNFSGKYEGLKSINIILYEIIAFFLVMIVLFILYRIFLKLSIIAEKIVEATIILSLPAKILGAVFGFFEMYLITYLVIFVISMPIFNVPMLDDSYLASGIIDKTPIISRLTNSVVKSVNEIKKEVNSDQNTEVINDKIIKVLVKNKLVSPKTIDKLNDKGKIRVKKPKQKPVTTSSKTELNNDKEKGE
ncbi:MAG: CvpA family protein [Bacilli bacterium]